MLAPVPRNARIRGPKRQRKAGASKLPAEVRLCDSPDNHVSESPRLGGFGSATYKSKFSSRTAELSSFPQAGNDRTLSASFRTSPEQSNGFDTTRFLERPSFLAQVRMEPPKNTTSVVGLDGSAGRSTPTEEPPACQHAPWGSLYAAVRSHMSETVRPSELVEIELLILTM